MRLAFAFVVLASCTLYQGHGDDTCAPMATAGAPAVTVKQLVNPSTLQCQTVDIGGPTCNPQCGPCPAEAEPAPPPWGACESQCTGLDQSTCQFTPGCRIALDWAKYYTNDPTAFIGCFAVDTDTDNAVGCTGLDAAGCARHDTCAGLYEAGTDIEQFQECIIENQPAGACTGQVLCQLAESCPPGTTPGITGGCYTGSCIPDQFCPQPGSNG